MIRVPVLVHPHHEHRARIELAINTANTVQAFASFEINEKPSLPQFATASKTVSPGAVLERLPTLAGGRRAIAVLQNRFADNYFSWESRDGLVITTADWEEHFAPPPLAIYLLYQFAATIISFGADLPENIPPEHEPPIGCFYDLCVDKDAIRLGIVAASVCATCEGTLAGMAVSDEALRAFDSVLSCVREASIRRARETPRHIFIAHGRSLAWRKLRDFLVTDLHLVVEEFGEEAPEGRTTQARLEQMLGRSRFAFAVMTAEDHMDDGESRARQNVIHELGLCQGKFGFDKAVMLVEKGVAEPSNMYGVTSIKFRPQRFGDAKKRIRSVLRHAGILPDRPALTRALRR